MGLPKLFSSQGDRMKWQYRLTADWAYVTVSVNDYHCGTIDMPRESFEKIRSELAHKTGIIEFIEEE